MGPGQRPVVFVTQENSLFGCADDTASIRGDPQVWVMTVMYDITIRDLKRETGKDRHSLVYHTLLVKSFQNKSLQVCIYLIKKIVKNVSHILK